MEQVITLQGNYRFPVPCGAGFTVAITGAFNGSTATVQYLNTTAGTAQVETATVVAASGCTSNGTCSLTFTQTDPTTAASLTVDVALTTAENSATLVATALAAGLNANGEFATKWLAAGSGADVVITRKRNHLGYFSANDTACNLAIPAGLGITAAPTSVNTTAGVGPTVATNPFSTTALALTAAGEKQGINMGSYNEINLAVTVANPTGIVVNVNPLVTIVR